MIKAILALILASLVACGGGSKGKNDDQVGGKEALTDSMSCEGKVPSLDKDGKPDPMRGFEVKVIGFVYSEGSTAASLITKYVFNDKGENFEETASRVWPKNETKHHLSTELLLAKIDFKSKSAELYKKYAIGADAFEMECK
jgi:hypothetical protein